MSASGWNRSCSVILLLHVAAGARGRRKPILSGTRDARPAPHRCGASCRSAGRSARIGSVQRLLSWTAPGIACQSRVRREPDRGHPDGAIAVDTSKNIFTLHGVDQQDKVVLRRNLRRDKFEGFLAEQPPTTVVLEACGG